MGPNLRRSTCNYLVVQTNLYVYLMCYVGYHIPSSLEDKGWGALMSFVATK